MNFKYAVIALLIMLLFLSDLASSQILILAPDELVDTVAPLKRFKTWCGRHTILLSLSEVYSKFPTYADEAEQVKKCIEHYEKANGIQYVLLVGDVDKFPVRWRWWGLPGQEGWAISDLYFADLYDNNTTTFDDWDNNNNGLYGEIEFGSDGTINNDNIDFLPDVSVGRIPASTDKEVTAYINKIITYELQTVPWAGWFKTAGLYTGTWPAYYNNVAKDTIAKYLGNQGFTTITKRYTDWTDPENPKPPANVPNAIITDFNNGVGFANYIGHGNTGGWYCVGFGNTQLTSLTNSLKLPIVLAGACDTGGFAWLARLGPYKDINGQGHRGTINGETLEPGAYPHVNLPKPACVQHGQVVYGGITYQFDPECFAESFVFGDPVGSTGAVAYLAERSGGQRFVVDLDKLFFKAYDDGGHRILGDMWKYMIEEYYALHGLGQANSWPHQPSDWEKGHVFDEPQKLVLFGDPSLLVGGAFITPLSGNVYNNASGPLRGFSRYRITGNVTVPIGQTLSADSTVSILFEHGKKITALEPNPSQGFIIKPGPGMSAYLLSIPPDPKASYVGRGVKISGQLKLRNNGEIKLY